MWEGLSASFGMLLSTLLTAESYFSHPKTIIISSVCHITGLVLLCVVSFEPFSGSSIACIDIFNVIAVILLAWGKAGVKFSLRPFLADQFGAHELYPVVNEDSVVAQTNVWLVIAWLLSILPAIFLIGRSWTLNLIITSSVMGIALILFLCGIPFYHKSDQLANVERHPFNDLIRVVKASILNRHMECSSSSDNFFENDENDQLEVPPLFENVLRRLDKAAIIDSSLERHEQEEAGRLCTMTQVKECKIFLIMVPWWIAFLVFGLLLSTGNTFFSEQGHNMAGSLLLVLILQKICERVSYLLPRKWVREPKWKLARFWAGMVISTFCFATAWRTEVFKLSVINKKRLLDKPDDIIKMSTFILAPQFCLLGLMKGLVKGGLDEFMIDQLPDTWKDYVREMNEFVVGGIGSLLSIVCICVNGSLFGTTLNRSRLDKYYKRLTLFSVANLCCFCIISSIYAHSIRAAKVGEESQSTVEIEIIEV